MPRRSSIELKSAEQILKMRAAGLVVARILHALREAAKPGVTTAELDALAREQIAAAGAVSSFLGYGGGFGLPPFPAVSCISVNYEIVHGIPGERRARRRRPGQHRLRGRTRGLARRLRDHVAVGTPSAEALALSETTRQAMWAGISAAHVGGRIGDIAHAVESSVRARRRRYGIIAEYTGHGIGPRCTSRRTCPTWAARAAASPDQGHLPGRGADADARLGGHGDP